MCRNVCIWFREKLLYPYGWIDLDWIQKVFEMKFCLFLHSYIYYICAFIPVHDVHIIYHTLVRAERKSGVAFYTTARKKVWHKISFESNTQHLVWMSALCIKPTQNVTLELKCWNEVFYGWLYKMRRNNTYISTRIHRKLWMFIMFYACVCVCISIVYMYVGTYDVGKHVIGLIRFSFTTNSFLLFVYSKALSCVYIYNIMWENHKELYYILGYIYR